jgi:hypothetical protein
LRFAVHRLGQRQASPRGVSRRDVPCSVVVSVGEVSAGPAPEGGLALASPPIHGPALRATLARICGIDLLDPAPGLVLKSGGKHAPPGSEDRTVQACLLTNVATGLRDGAPGRAGHARHVQVLNPDQVVAAGDLGRYLLHPISPRIGIAGVQPRMPRLELRPTVGAALGPRQTALQPLHVSVGRSLVRVPVGQGECHRHAPVDSDDLARGGTGNRDGDGSERDVPAPHPVAGHTVRPRVRHRTRQLEPDPSEPGDQHPGPAAVQGLHVLRSRTPGRGSTGSSIGGPAPAHTGTRRTPSRSRKEKWETKNHLPGREAITAKSGAVCAPYGAFPPGSAMLDMAVGTRRPRRWKRYQRTRSQLVRLGFAVTWFTASLPEACWQQFARGPSAPSKAILCEKFGQAVVGRGVDPAGRVEQALQPAGGQQLLHGPPGGQLAVGPGP